MVTSHNAFYGLKTPKGTGKYLHTIHGLLVFLFPFGLWYVAGWDPRSLFVFPSGSSWQYVAAGYVALCWLTGFVLFPLNTLRRVLRTKPAALIALQSRVAAMSGQLGRRP